MKTFKFPINRSAIFIALPMALNSTIGYSQSNDCAQAQAQFVGAMEVFRTEFFEREGSNSDAETVMQQQVIPNVTLMESVCPTETMTAVNAVVEKAKVGLTDPNRTQVVECDKAIITYRKLISKFDNVSLSGYDAYRALLYSDVDPSAKAAVEACPQMPALAQQTQADIVERQKRLDKMQELENSRPTMADTIETNNEEFLESQSGD